MIKGIAVCLLLWHHLFGTEGDITGNGIRLHFLSLHQTANTGAAARICVWLFIFISAYGWTSLYGAQVSQGGGLPDGEALRKWLKTRYLRLMKPFWLCWAVFLVLSLFIFTYAAKRYAPNPLLYAALDFFGIADLFGTPMLAGIWWYMAFAQVMLFTLPIVIHAADLFGGFLIPVAYLAVRFISEGIVSNYGGHYSIYAMIVIFGVLAARYDIFGLCGKWLAKLKERQAAGRIAAALVSPACLAAALVLIYTDYKYIYPADRWGIYGCIMSLAAVLLIAAVRYGPEIPVPGRVFLFLGRHSGNIFLVHGFLLVRFRHALYASGNVFVTWLTLMGGSIVLSYLLIFAGKAVSGIRVKRNHIL